MATMDRILADDFVLVTGRGKVFTKSTLLEETRNGNMVYEHKEDSQQTVRVWGDTAVITAFLWAKGTNAGKLFTTISGSAMSMAALRIAGDIFLDNNHCRC